MSDENMARSLYEALSEAMRNAESKGETSAPPHVWKDIKGQLAREHPREFQHAIDLSIEYNNGVYSDDVFDEHLDRIHEGYKERLQQGIIDKG